MNAPATLDVFEAYFKASPDPWGTMRRRDEALKRGSIGRAVGAPLGRVLELGCGNGSNTIMLLQRARRVVALDASPSALGLTRAHAGSERLKTVCAALPANLPRGQFDACVIAELLYYLSPRDIRQLAKCVRHIDRIILAHHHIAFSDCTTSPAQVHKIFSAAIGRPLQTWTRNSRWRIDIV